MTAGCTNQQADERRLNPTLERLQRLASLLPSVWPEISFNKRSLTRFTFVLGKSCVLATRGSTQVSACVSHTLRAHTRIDMYRKILFASLVVYMPSAFPQSKAFFSTFARSVHQGHSLPLPPAFSRRGLCWSEIKRWRAVRQISGLMVEVALSFSLLCTSIVASNTCRGRKRRARVTGGGGGGFIRTSHSCVSV